MDTPQIQSHIKELQSQVFSYSNKKTNGINNISFSIEEILSSKKIYIAIPIIVFIIIIIIRPKFLYNEMSDKKGNIVNSLSFRKILICWLILSLLFMIGLFGYKYNKKV